MVERPPASAPGATRPPRSGALPSTETEHHTARIAVQRGGALPGWLWGMLGCLTVLGIGFAVLFMVMKPGAAPPIPAATTVVAPVPTPPPPAAGARAPGIEVEPIAAPGRAPGIASTPKPRPTVRAVKVARSPGAARTAEAAAAGDDSGGSDDEEQAPPKPKTAAREARDRPSAPAGEESEEK